MGTCFSDADAEGRWVHVLREENLTRKEPPILRNFKARKTKLITVEHVDNFITVLCE